MAILLETLTLYQRLQRKGVLKINIGSKVNTNAITEANFKLQKDLMAWVLQKINSNNPLTQFNYSSLQMKEYTPSLPLMEYLRKSFDVGSEGLAFATASFNNDFSSKVTERQKQV
jgi:hypothetical protein